MLDNRWTSLSLFCSMVAFVDTREALCWDYGVTTRLLARLLAFLLCGCDEARGFSCQMVCQETINPSHLANIWFSTIHVSNICSRAVDGAINTNCTIRHHSRQLPSSRNTLGCTSFRLSLNDNFDTECRLGPKKNKVLTRNPTAEDSYPTTVTSLCHSHYRITYVFV